MNELQILSAVKNNGGSISYGNLINIGLADPFPNILADRELIRKMISADILFGKAVSHGTISFGPNGHLRYRDLLFQEEANRQAYQSAAEEQVRLKGELAAKQMEEKAKKKSDRIFEIFLMLLSAFVSNLDRIILWVASFF